MIVRQFEAQFTPDGPGYLFRRGMRDAAVRVTAAERDAFLTAYTVAANRLWWAFTGGMIAVMVGLATVFAVLRIDPQAGHFEALVAASLGALMALYLWQGSRLLSAPARALAGRPPVAPPLDRTAFRRQQRRTQSWLPFVIGPLGIALLWARFGPRGELLTGGHLLWPLGAVVYLAFMAFHAREKWRAGRTAR